MHDPLPTGARVAAVALDAAIAAILALFASSCGAHTTAASAVPGGVAPNPLPKVAVTPAAERGAKAQREHVALGEVTVVIMTSRTASLFHVIDQLSRWSPFSHPQYQSWRPPAEVADPLLARHVKLREKRSWGQGLEAALYVDDPDYAHALEVAVARGLLTQSEAAEEKAVFDGLAPLLEPHLAHHAFRANELVVALRRESKRFERLFTAWQKLLGSSSPASVEFTFVPSPGQGAGGGGANGGAVVVELPEDGAIEPTLTTVAHETIHVFLKPKKEALADTAARCGQNLDATTVGEAFAYATAPGLFAWGAGKTPLETRAEEAPLGTPYRGFYEAAIGLRPELQKSLYGTGGDRADFTALLATVCEVYKARSH